MGKRGSAVASRKSLASALVSILAAPVDHCRFLLSWFPGGEGLRCGSDGRVDLEVDDFDRLHIGLGVAGARGTELDVAHLS